MSFHDIQPKHSCGQAERNAESELIFLHISFMQIHINGGQLSIHGNVVNVSADVNSTVSTLPRPISESQKSPS